MGMVRDVWAVGAAYDAYVGRWSVRVAETFVDRLVQPAGADWLDVGCGTGALTAVVATTAAPGMVVGVDPSVGFLATAAARGRDRRTAFLAADARALPFHRGRFDVVVSGLALNFVPEPARAAAEFARVLRPGGAAAAYVWDYAGGMAMMRHFWDSAASLDPAAAELDEGRRFPLCRPEALRELWLGAGFGDVIVEPIDVPTVFADFDDYWTPFLGGQGPAPSYLMSLGEGPRAALRDLLRTRLPADEGGSIPLAARAWSVRGTASATPARRDAVGVG